MNLKIRTTLMKQNTLSLSKAIHKKNTTIYRGVKIEIFSFNDGVVE
jgi:hypothetical protein